MPIQAFNTTYHQIVNSDLIQTTIDEIQSLIYRIFINPSDLCLLGHTVTIDVLSYFFDITPRGSISYYILFEIIFLTIQEARQFYNSFKHIVL